MCVFIHTHADGKFERAYDSWGEQDMLDMKMIVHFEVDACLPTEDPGTNRATETGPTPAVDSPADALGSITLSSLRRCRRHRQQLYMFFARVPISPKTRCSN